MEKSVNTKHIFLTVSEMVINPKLKQATTYITPNLTCKVTRKTYKFKNGKTARRMKMDGNKIELMITYGAPNCAEREFIKKCKKAKEPFPVKKIQFKYIK